VDDHVIKITKNSPIEIGLVSDGFTSNAKINITIVNKIDKDI